MEDKTREITERCREIERLMGTDEVVSDPVRLKELAREHSRLIPIIKCSGKLEQVRRNIAGNRELIAEESDRELVSLAEEDLSELEKREKALAAELQELLIPRDPLDDKNVIMEIRAGTGGNEAGLFCADLFRMYSHYIDSTGWRLEVISMNSSEAGGMKEVIFSVSGEGVYGKLKYESGVHRVQRVPATESSGRIHTSAATVAVLPEAKEVDLRINPADLKVDVFRSSGPGGQSVNTTDSAVRITHLPTQIVVSCQDEKSQLKNKNKAMKVLRSRLLDARLKEASDQRDAERRLQVGTGDRSAKIRTYNFPQSRVTDHRIGLTLHKLESILGGDLEELVEALTLASMEKRK
ncbi:MAG: peptide chain release factor 1 [Gemmatimonadota bacterium]|nr:peptide chain release factor 1 [Gemmatimonadota bacterium]